MGLKLSGIGRFRPSEPFLDFFVYCLLPLGLLITSSLLPWWQWWLSTLILGQGVCNPAITFLPAPLLGESWNCCPCFAQRKMKAWVSEPVQGQKLGSTREMQDVGGDGAGSGSSPVWKACRSKFRTCALFLKRWLRSSCVWNVCMGVLRVVCLCVCVYSSVGASMCVSIYVSICLSRCVEGGTEVRDRGWSGDRKENQLVKFRLAKPAAPLRSIWSRLRSHC